MPWTYVQSTGKLSDPAGQWVATGYSGHGEGVNNPADDAIPDVGPIPAGSYIIGAAITHPTCGPIAMRLDPVAGTDTHGRAGFLIHGDSAAGNHTASHGCIILPPNIRTQINASTDRGLVVTAQ